MNYLKNIAKKLKIVEDKVQTAYQPPFEYYEQLKLENQKMIQENKVLMKLLISSDEEFRKIKDVV